MLTAMEAEPLTDDVSVMVTDEAVDVHRPQATGQLCCTSSSCPDVYWAPKLQFAPSQSLQLNPNTSVNDGMSAQLLPPVTAKN